MDCGPTCLAIVAQHYKVQVSGDYLLALEAGYNRQLDAMGHWAVSVSSDARWQREPFFASLLSAPLSGADDIGNVRSPQIWFLIWWVLWFCAFLPIVSTRTKEVTNVEQKER